jgi:hypothetical protein
LGLHGFRGSDFHGFNESGLEVHKIFVTRGSLVFDSTITRYQLVHHQVELLTRQTDQLVEKRDELELW